MTVPKQSEPVNDSYPEIPEYVTEALYSVRHFLEEMSESETLEWLEYYPERYFAAVAAMCARKVRS